MISIASAVYCRSFLCCPGLTWCGTFYFRQRINLARGVATTCSNFSTRDRYIITRGDYDSIDNKSDGGKARLKNKSKPPTYLDDKHTDYFSRESSNRNNERYSDHTTRRFDDRQTNNYTKDSSKRHYGNRNNKSYDKQDWRKFDHTHESDYMGQSSNRPYRKMNNRSFPDKDWRKFGNKPTNNYMSQFSNKSYGSRRIDSDSEEDSSEFHYRLNNNYNGKYSNRSFGGRNDDSNYFPDKDFTRQPSHRYQGSRNSWYENKYPDKDWHRKTQRSRVRPFMDKDISHDHREEELEDDDDELENLPDTDRFGTGTGEFSEKNTGRKPGRKTVLPENWSETFGTIAVDEEGEKMEESVIAGNEKYWDELEKEDQEDKIHNHIRLSRYNRRHVPHWYARQIMKLGKQGKIREAIEVFDKLMIEQHRVKPTYFEFSILIKLLAQVGYTEKAFQLYNKMKAMKIYCDGHVYSSLFNACANSPWPEDTLKLANKLQEEMLLKGIKPNYITTLAMIKAYSRTTDINMAFSLADEAIKLDCTEHLMSNLLTACISDKKAGFRHAIIVWRKFLKLGIKPSIWSYNLLLRAVRDCGIGGPEEVNTLLGRTIEKDGNIIETEGNEVLKLNSIENSNENLDQLEEEEDIKHDRSADKSTKRKQRQSVKSFREIDKLLEKYELTKEENQRCDSHEDVTSIGQTSENSLVIVDKESSDVPVRKEWCKYDIFENSVIAAPLENSGVIADEYGEVNFPNILDPDEDFSSLVQVKAVKHKEDRLALLGGMNGFLRRLEEEDIEPDIVTFTQLADVAPPDLEDTLIDKMFAKGFKPDLDFYSLLIRKRLKYNKKGAFDLFIQLKNEDLVPDLRTYSCLALACNDMKVGLQLIEEMLAADIMPNIYTINGLIIASHNNFLYKQEVLRKMQELSIEPNLRLLEIVENQMSRAKLNLAKLEKNDSDEDAKKKASMLRQKLQSFLNFYDKWTQYNVMETEEHPWKHFMEPKGEELNE